MLSLASCSPIALTGVRCGSAGLLGHKAASRSKAETTTSGKTVLIFMPT